MLEIVLTKQAIYFDSVSDEHLELLKSKVGDELQENNNKGYKITGKPEKLYKILFDLSYTFDIEIR